MVACTRGGPDASVQLDSGCHYQRLKWHSSSWLAVIAVCVYWFNKRDLVSGTLPLIREQAVAGKVFDLAEF